MDMYSNNNAVLGTRTIGAGGGTFTLSGPAQAGSGTGVVRVSTPHTWVLARTLVDGEADMAAAHAVQDGLLLKGSPGGPEATYPTRNAPASDYFTAAHALMVSDPPQSEDLGLLRRVARLGLSLGPWFEPMRYTPAELAQLEAGIAEAKGLMLTNAGRQGFVGGWSYPRANLGDYGQDYLYRAMVALGGLAALPPAEAMYMKPQGDGGGLRFTGDGLYRLSLPAQMPVDGFWSLTMYEATPEGQFFLTENPLNRYAIGDRTPGLQRNADGGLDLWIGRTDPGGERTANWLPAPAKGPFAMSLRAYLPQDELLDGRFRLPPIKAV